jgi:hypothetical protein
LGSQEIGFPRLRLIGQQCLSEPGTIASSGEEVLVACGDEWVAVRQVLAGGRGVPAGELLHAGGRLHGN